MRVHFFELGGKSGGAFPPVEGVGSLILEVVIDVVFMSRLVVRVIQYLCCDVIQNLIFREFLNRQAELRGWGPLS